MLIQPVRSSIPATHPGAIAFHPKTHIGCSLRGHTHWDGPGLRIAVKTASLNSVRHSFRTEPKLFLPQHDRCSSEISSAPPDKLTAFNPYSGFLHESLEDARQRTPCYLARRHATAACVTSTGRGTRRLSAETVKLNEFKLSVCVVLLCGK